MTNYICINGKKAELTEEQMKALGIELPKASPFDRVAKDKQFYYIGSNGVVGITRECNNGFDDNCFNTANYCIDLDMMRQRALHEILNRLLWRYSMENKVKRTDGRIWTIHKYDGKGGGVKVGWTHESVMKFGCVYFDSEEIAEAAFKEVYEPFMKAHPEFKW